MSTVRIGDLVWVKTPRRISERKVGTIMEMRKTKHGVRYVVEWEPVVVDLPNHRTEYLSNEIAKANGIPIKL